MKSTIGMKELKKIAPKDTPKEEITTPQGLSQEVKEIKKEKKQKRKRTQRFFTYRGITFLVFMKENSAIINEFNPATNTFERQIEVNVKQLAKGVQEFAKLIHAENTLKELIIPKQNLS